MIPSPRPTRDPGKEAQKARNDGGKTHLEGPKKPGHAKLQGASWLDLAKASKARLHYPQFLLLGQNVLSNRNNFFMSKIILFPNVFLFSLRYFINTEQWSFS